MPILCDNTRIAGGDSRWADRPDRSDGKESRLERADWPSDNATCSRHHTNWRSDRADSPIDHLPEESPIIAPGAALESLGDR